MGTMAHPVTKGVHVGKVKAVSGNFVSVKRHGKVVAYPSTLLISGYAPKEGDHVRLHWKSIMGAQSFIFLISPAQLGSDNT